MGNASRGGGRGLSRPRILKAALELVDAEGLAALSMRRLGEQLGVQAMSLYRHVKDKDDLLDGLQGAVLADMEMPASTGDLGERATSWTRALRKALIKHPNAIPLFASRAVRDPEALFAVESALSMLSEGGLSDPAALRLYQTMLAFALGHAILEGAPRAPVSVSPEALESPKLPTLRRISEQTQNYDSEAEFEAGLKLMTEGIRAFGEHLDAEVSGIFRAPPSGLRLDDDDDDYI